MITARSSNSRGSRPRRSPLGFRDGQGSRRRQFQDSRGTGSNTVRCLRAIVCSNGWDDVTAALQLLCHLDGDALNVAFTVSGVSASGAGIFDKVIIGSLQLSRAFIDIDPLIQLQMVWDRFIDGQAGCALRRHLDSLGPDNPMADIVDCCWCVGELSHIEVKIEQQTRRTDALRMRSVR